MKRLLLLALCGLPMFPFVFAAAQSGSTVNPKKQELIELEACAGSALQGFRPIADTRTQRFNGKVALLTALCRGGQKAVQLRFTPWVDFSNYWGTGDLSSLPQGYFSTSAPQFRGVSGALLDLEYQRIELIKFNLFDNNGTYEDYVAGRNGLVGAALKTWPQMRLPQSSPYYAAVGGDGEQICKGELIRARTLTGICNDIRNPLMGSSGTPFARNVEFETTFPDLEQNQLTQNRHGGRINLLTPDPQVISRKLFTRVQSNPDACNHGLGLPNDSTDANCDYQKAPFFNVLAAYWIQFMTHDWFSHMEEGHNAAEMMAVGCTTQKVNGVETPLSPDDAQKLGCRPADRVDKAYVQQDSAPGTFT
ncbi:MAG TPA: peroxidase family protein, partial [Candidatus Bathyarchaeia archaeon]|nr:peroxidase family protein [Candidatus Bathyarchaeia archaeon]